MGVQRRPRTTFRIVSGVILHVVLGDQSTKKSVFVDQILTFHS